jgi:hypothetical protein
MGNKKSSPNIVRVIKLRVRWKKHTARTGYMSDAYGKLVGKSVRKEVLGEPVPRLILPLFSYSSTTHII